MGKELGLSLASVGLPDGSWLAALGSVEGSWLGELVGLRVPWSKLVAIGSMIAFKLAFNSSI